MTIYKVLVFFATFVLTFNIMNLNFDDWMNWDENKNSYINAIAAFLVMIYGLLQSKKESQTKNS